MAMPGPDSFFIFRISETMSPFTRLVLFHEVLVKVREKTTFDMLFIPLDLNGHARTGFILHLSDFRDDVALYQACIVPRGLGQGSRENDFRHAVHPFGHRGIMLVGARRRTRA